MTESDSMQRICPQCGTLSVPKLRMVRIGQTDSTHLGAYCVNCGRWLTWLPQTQAWMTLYVAQPVGGPDLDWRIRFSGFIQEMSEYCHEAARAKGWMEQKRTPLECLMLIVSECAEAAEAYRAPEMQQSDHIPEFTAAEEEYADILVRVFNHAPEQGVSPERLGLAFVAKLQFNATRPHRHGGKKV